MEFETRERCGRIHVVKNGVESAEFVISSFDGYTVFAPESWGEWKTLNAALESIARLYMDDWYTATQAAEVLVEMGVFDEPPSPQRVTKWCRDGLLPGAIKVRALRGSGGAWRIPASALLAFAERRKQ